MELSTPVVLSCLIAALVVCDAAPAGNLRPLSNAVELSSRHRRSSFLGRDWTDPEITETAVEIVQRWDYPVEQYNVTTEDGYILLLVRIPHGRNETSKPSGPRPVVYLQHGLEASCVDWIANLPNESAAFIFADAGYDVWMGNFRGNCYSSGHVKYNTSQHEYWRFSWDEMAKYDLPAMINESLSITGAPFVYYVGHSMGTSTIFAKMSLDPDFGKNIKKMYGLAPVATVSHIKGLLPLLGHFVRLLQWMGVDDLFPISDLQKTLAKYVCGSAITDWFCEDVMSMMTGPESNQLNVTRMPVYAAHTPAGTSVRTVAHYSQMHVDKKFQMYDYGRKENEEVYLQTTPPLYDLSKVNIPASLYSGGDDWLADPEDVNELISQLPNVASNVSLPHFNHQDFVWGLRAAPEIYEPIRDDIQTDYEMYLKSH